ncbi:MAG: hypothetical protein U0528_13825 [Anaerolineae bacterium]
MMIWDTQTGELHQITDFFNQEGAKPFFAAYYTHHWFDDDTLLVGVDYQMQGPPQKRQLFLYHRSTEVIEVISADFGGGMIVDSSKKQFALGTPPGARQLRPSTFPDSTTFVFGA